MECLHIWGTCGVHGESRKTTNDYIDGLVQD